MRRAWNLWLRWWRRLTAMRTAIILLFLLALAAIPGSLLPQRSLSQTNVARYFADHPTLAPVLDRLYLFDVFSSPWFAAIYLLLFISLVGCVLPRAAEHFRALRRPPPPAPRNLLRLPDSARLDTPLEGPAALDVVEEELRVRRYRVVRRAGAAGPELSAEKGYLKEAGNLLFHLSLVALLLALAGGKLWGYEGSILVTEDAGLLQRLPAVRHLLRRPPRGGRRPRPAVRRPRGLPRRVRGRPDRLVVHRRHQLRRTGRGGRAGRPSASTTRCASTAPGST